MTAPTTTSTPQPATDVPAKRDDRVPRWLQWTRQNPAHGKALSDGRVAA